MKPHINGFQVFRCLATALITPAGRRYHKHMDAIPAGFNVLTFLNILA
ncbi:hypothetical protein CEV31_3041 [Brucella thiophenivorans]|uniref:Uncharacterized protein n=1 Tax=Brucella thiophenivorans TaxID=571255 RepID=A0A256FJ01_9HYPH|nr:hypothetical protein CEV31_3041 [Brucella thiophenivorans]